MPFDTTGAVLDDTPERKSGFDTTGAVLEPTTKPVLVRGGAMTPIGETAIPAGLANLAQGIGRGVTFGLTNYPAAAVQMGVRALTGGGGPENTYAANLADIEARNAALRKESTAFKTGEIAGGMLGGGTVGVGRGFLGTLARQTGLGALSGFNQETLPTEPYQDPLSRTLVGAGTGAVGGTIVGAAGALAKAPENFVKKQFINYQETRAAQALQKALQKDPKLIETARSQLVANLDSQINAISGMKASQAIPQINALNRAKREALVATDDVIMDKILKNEIRNLRVPAASADLRSVKGANTRISNVENKEGQELMNYVKGALSKESSKERTEFVDMAKSMLPGIAVGGMSGAGLGAIMSAGNPEQALANMYSMGALGAGAGGAYALRQMATQPLMRTGASMLSNYPLSGTTQAFGATVPYNAPAAAAAGAITPITTSQDYLTRLQDVIDRANTRFGGNQ